VAVNSEIKQNKENHQEAPEFNSDLYRTSNRQKKTYAGNPSSLFPEFSWLFMFMFFIPDLN
jgi:hypothetical protein